MGKPLEEVDAEGSSRALNFVESDGLSRVRVRHVSFMPFIRDRPSEVQAGRYGQIERSGEFSGGVFRVFASRQPGRSERLADPAVVWAQAAVFRTQFLLWI